MKGKDEKTVFSQSNSPSPPSPQKVGEREEQLFILREKDECHGVGGQEDWAKNRHPVGV